MWSGDVGVEVWIFNKFSSVPLLAEVGTLEVERLLGWVWGWPRHGCEEQERDEHLVSRKSGDTRIKSAQRTFCKRTLRILEVRFTTPLQSQWMIRYGQWLPLCVVHCSLCGIQSPTPSNTTPLQFHFIPLVNLPPVSHSHSDINHDILISSDTFDVVRTAAH